MNDNELVIKRFCELSTRAYERGYTTYTNFLNADEIGILYSSKAKLKTNYVLNGGYDNAERCVACFCDKGEDFPPIICIKIEPLQQKFADRLSHRDFLGSLMNLGIEREMLGDILIKDNIGYVFCLDKISDYIISELDKIKHTSVQCSKCDVVPDFINTLPDEEEYIVSSIRVDTVASAVFKISRNAISQMINQGNVYINSRPIYKDAILLKNGDTVTVRGKGKFIFSRIINETKKHKIVAGIMVYK